MHCTNIPAPFNINTLPQRFVRASPVPSSSHSFNPCRLVQLLQHTRRTMCMNTLFSTGLLVFSLLTIIMSKCSLAAPLHSSIPKQKPTKLVIRPPPLHLSRDKGCNLCISTRLPALRAECLRASAKSPARRLRTKLMIMGGNLVKLELAMKPRTASLKLCVALLRDVLGSPLVSLSSPLPPPSGPTDLSSPGRSGSDSHWDVHGGVHIEELHFFAPNARLPTVFSINTDNDMTKTALLENLSNNFFSRPEISNEYKVEKANVGNVDKHAAARFSLYLDRRQQ